MKDRHQHTCFIACDGSPPSGEWGFIPQSLYMLMPVLNQVHHLLALANLLSKAFQLHLSSDSFLVQETPFLLCSRNYI